jgi:hypothetical protein
MASAMIEPSLVALAITELAACAVVSAASSPASRIFRRAVGLALIAAAAAASVAASISLLVAAFASFSTVPFLDLDREGRVAVEPEEVCRVDFAKSPPSERRQLNDSVFGVELLQCEFDQAQ